MPIPSKYLADFEPNESYHIYNRTNNREDLFRCDENRYFFLRKYHQYLSVILDTFTWNLLPNHFHFVSRLKSLDEIEKNLSLLDKKIQTGTEKLFLKGKLPLSELAESQFKRFFQSYAQSYNKVYQRQGNLFNRPFKRIRITDEEQFTQACIYTHANAVKHKLVRNFMTYKWSSWNGLFKEPPIPILKSELIDWFGGQERLIKTHKEMTSYYYDSPVAIEE